MPRQPEQVVYVIPSGHLARSSENSADFFSSFHSPKERSATSQPFPFRSHIPQSMVLAPIPYHRISR
jgi:hypothetical protein